MRLLIKRKQLIFSDSSCKQHQCPVPIRISSSIYRIFFADRDNDNHSKIKYFDFCLNKRKIIYYNNLIIANSINSHYDMDGKIPSSILYFNNEYYLFYTGINAGKKFPYHNSIGVLKSKDLQSFNLLTYDPIIPSNSIKKNHFNSAGNIFRYKNLFYLFYSSCDEWRVISNSNEPIYNIKLATSVDLREWNFQKNQIIRKGDDIGGAVNFSIVNINQFFIAFSSIRKMTDYRINKNSAYKIRSFQSKDLYNWDPLDIEYEDDSLESNWDNIMRCYPSAILHDNTIFIFFNGNGFGKSGIGLAEVDIII